MPKAKGVEFLLSELGKNYNVTPKDTTKGLFDSINKFKKLVEKAKEIEIKNCKSSYSSGYTNAIYSE